MMNPFHHKFLSELYDITTSWSTLSAISETWKSSFQLSLEMCKSIHKMSRFVIGQNDQRIDMWTVLVCWKGRLPGNHRISGRFPVIANLMIIRMTNAAVQNLHPHIVRTCRPALKDHKKFIELSDLNSSLISLHIITRSSRIIGCGTTQNSPGFQQLSQRHSENMLEISFMLSVQHACVRI